jgi:TonB family protein
VKRRFLIAALCASVGFSQNDIRSSLAHYHAGETFLQQGDLQSAANEFREALNGDPEPKWIEAECHMNLGTIFTMTGQYERAAREFKQADRWFDIASYPSPPSEAEPLDRTEPEYSQEARAAELEGTVLLSTVIASDGSAHDLSVTQTLGLGLDEKAIQAAGRWRFKPAASNALTVAVDFRMPSRQSRWHLIRVAFDPLEGASRPTFLRTQYPLGAGISSSTMEEGRLLGAIGRLGTATLSFDVDEHGLPGQFRVERASYDVWGNEAIEVVRDWRFIPGTKNGIAVSVPCTVDLVWGPRILTRTALEWAQSQLNASSTASEPFSSPAPGVVRP